MTLSGMQDAAQMEMTITGHVLILQIIRMKEESIKFICI